ncbi:YjjG family noncanonical pyrimidine nucleotidase [Clostridium sp. HBUAS56010]|uniref:YjjG family noncanonical pyrimidine nucleotidase n=1 Tax=Clostridium sp. HBUAS56010 TaxID=2571127 RepID=UPI0011778B5F|nr:YjjG family noncanonical pyrimidine nucleotidase [Clostridium sp. HBUAS56010]
MYEFYLLDIDNTLLNFDAAEQESFRKLMESYDIPFQEDLFTRYKEINKNLWNLLEQGKIDKPTILTGRFREFFSSLELDINPSEAEHRFQNHLSDGKEMMPNAEEVLRCLKDAGKKLYSASNGVYATQIRRLKIAGLFHYFEGMFISEKVGFEKPNIGFFDHCFNNIKDFNKTTTIMVGDSLTSDIQGALNSGIASCLYSPTGNNPSLKATHTISDLRELLSL